MPSTKTGHRPRHPSLIIACLAAMAALSLPPLPARSQTTALAPTTASSVITVAHMRITSALPFEQVRRKLEAAAPLVDPALLRALVAGDQEQIKTYEKTGPTLSIFLVRDHGAILHIAGEPRHLLQYEIGNALTATKMTRHQPQAALYAPLRVVLLEDAQGHGVFEYDKPSTLFGQFGDDQVRDVARGLDAALEALLLNASS